MEFSKLMPRKDSEKSSHPSDEETSPFLPDSDSSRGSTRSKPEARTVIWILSCVAILVAGFVGGFTVGQQKSHDLGTFVRVTDLAPAKPFIKSQSVTFTGSPMFLENGSFGVPNPGPVRYTGTPSHEVDEAWKDLTRGRYFRITEEEAIGAFGAAKDEYWSDEAGGYMAGLDVFHALHCLNQLRMVIWSDYYPDHHQVTGTKLIHREHCIDHIRQMLMCGGDMTPIPTVWTDKSQRNYVHSDVPHSCRDFSQLREFLAVRGPGGTDEPPASSLKKHQ